MSSWAEDRLAVQDVMQRYAAGVDDRDLDLYRSCFADDVEVLGFGQETMHGADMWTNYVRNALEAYGETQHMLSPVYATIDGDEADARTDVQALHYMKAQEGAILTLWATYRTKMRRQADGAWKIVRHELVSRGTRIFPPAG
jgi:uncharacterized protein (TIGR02246 family)